VKINEALTKRRFRIRTSTGHVSRVERVGQGRLAQQGVWFNALGREREKVIEGSKHRQKEQADAEAEADQPSFDRAHRLARRGTLFILQGYAQIRMQFRA
jgi:hypothetical protein